MSESATSSHSKKFQLYCLIANPSEAFIISFFSSFFWGLNHKTHSFRFLLFILGTGIGITFPHSLCFCVFIPLEHNWIKMFLQQHRQEAIALNNDLALFSPSFIDLKSIKCDTFYTKKKHFLLRSFLLTILFDGTQFWSEENRFHFLFPSYFQEQNIIFVELFSFVEVSAFVPRKTKTNRTQMKQAILFNLPKMR